MHTHTTWSSVNLLHSAEQNPLVSKGQYSGPERLHSSCRGEQELAKFKFKGTNNLSYEFVRLTWNKLRLTQKNLKRVTSCCPVHTNKRDHLEQFLGHLTPLEDEK